MSQGCGEAPGGVEYLKSLTRTYLAKLGNQYHERQSFESVTIVKLLAIR